MAWLAYKNDLRVRYFERVSVNFKKKKKKKKKKNGGVFKKKKKKKKKKKGGGFKKINKGAKLLKKLWCCVGGRV